SSVAGRSGIWRSPRSRVGAPIAGGSAGAGAGAIDSTSRASTSFGSFWVAWFSNSRVADGALSRGRLVSDVSFAMSRLRELCTSPAAGGRVAPGMSRVITFAGFGLGSDVIRSSGGSAGSGTDTVRGIRGDSTGPPYENSTLAVAGGGRIVGMASDMYFGRTGG